jgi:hypothetical protein
LAKTLEYLSGSTQSETLSENPKASQSAKLWVLP